MINGFVLVPMIHGTMVKTTLEGQDVTISTHSGKVYDVIGYMFQGIRFNNHVHVCFMYD